MKKILIVLALAVGLAFTNLGAAKAYDYYYDYGGYDNYYDYYPYDYSDYGYDYGYDDYNSYYYPYSGYDYYYPYDYSNGWYDDSFYNNYNQYYNNGWDYNYIPWDWEYNWDNYSTNNSYNYGWDNNNGPMYIWNNNQNNPTFNLSNYNDYFDKYHLYNYYPSINSNRPQEISIKKIEFISREDTTKNIVVDNSRADCQISQARIVVSRTTFIKIQQTVIKTGDINMDINPDHQIKFYSPNGNFQENNAAIYLSKN